MDMTNKQLRMIDTALGAYVAKLQLDLDMTEEGTPRYVELLTAIDGYSALREDIEILLLRY